MVKFNLILVTVGAVFGAMNAVAQYQSENSSAMLGWIAATCWAVALAMADLKMLKCPNCGD